MKYHGRFQGIMGFSWRIDLYFSMKFRKLKFQIIEAVSIKLASFATPYPVHIVIPELKH